MARAVPGLLRNNYTLEVDVANPGCTGVQIEVGGPLKPT